MEYKCKKCGWMFKTETVGFPGSIKESCPKCGSSNTKDTGGGAKDIQDIQRDK